LVLAGIFTHFASAESDVKFADAQLASFDQLLNANAQLIPATCRVHMASTFATIRHQRFHKSMVRVGLAWAGYGIECMEGEEWIAQADQLRPIVSWKSHIVQIKSIAKGTPVGYGSRWSAKRNSVIGLVPVGYADGYPMGLGARDGKPKAASVAVLGNSGSEPIGYAPVVGAINMDQLTIDLTDVISKAARQRLNCAVGSQVELISADVDAPNHLPRIANLAGTIPHEMLCRLNSRLSRVYIAPAGAIEQPKPVEALAS
jgi:alanine racemase